MLGLLLNLLFIVVVFAIVWWVLQRAPIPPPFRWVVDAILAVIAIVVLLQFVWPSLRGLGSP